MPKLIRLLGVLFTVFILACSNLTSHSPDPYARTLKYPVYIDNAFSDDQKDQIKDALTMWNNTLNGYQEFYVADDKWAPNMITGFDGEEVILNQREGFRIIKMEPAATSEGVLGWVNDLGDEVVHLVPVRCEMYGGKDGLRIVAAHEIGHSLMINHNGVEGALLYPFFTHQLPMDDGKCIDYFTVLQLSKSNERFKLEHLNYCPPR